VERTFLIVLPHHDAELWRCTRNIRGAAMMPCADLNAYEMIRPQRVIFTLEAARQFLARAGAARSEQNVGVSENG